MESSIYQVLQEDQDHLSAVNPSYLLQDQRHAHDIIDWNLAETLVGRAPPQLLMLIPREGGVGKLKTIQTITENFCSKGVGHILAKAAYTGIAASLVDGKTLHVLVQIPVNGHTQSQKTARKLAAFWKNKLCLIIDEKSMVSRTFFARLSAYIVKGKALAGESDTNKPFGGVNIILSGDFHQFPPAPRHAVRKHWNAIMAQTMCQRNGTQFFVCTAYDTFQGRPLTLSERLAVATKKNKGSIVEGMTRGLRYQTKSS